MHLNIETYSVKLDWFLSLYPCLRLSRANAIQFLICKTVIYDTFSCPCLSYYISISNWTNRFKCPRNSYNYVKNEYKYNNFVIMWNDQTNTWKASRYPDISISPCCSILPSKCGLFQGNPFHKTYTISNTAIDFNWGISLSLSLSDRVLRVP